MSSRRLRSRSSGEAEAAAEAARLEQLELAAKRIFRPGRSLDADKLKAFLTENASGEILQRFEELKTQSSKLALIWTTDFNPPLTAVELVEWESAQEDAAAEVAGKELIDMDSDELKEYVSALDHVPEGIVAKLVELNVTGATLLDLTEDDIASWAEGDGARRRWIKSFIKAERESHEGPEVVMNSASLSNSQLDEACKKGDFALARHIIGKMEAANQHRDKVNHKSLEEACRKGDFELARDTLKVLETQAQGRQGGLSGSFLENLQAQKRINDLQSGIREQERLNRDDLLKQHLGITRNDDDSKAAVTFLPQSDRQSGQTALSQIQEIIGPKKGVNKCDAAYALRLEAKGIESRYPLVLLDTPEGEESSLRQVDLVERLLRNGGEMTAARSHAFNHIRTLLRTSSQQLTPLESGCLAIGGIKLALASDKAFLSHFQPSVHDETLPDPAKAKLRLCASRKDEHLRLLARIEETVELAKRPVVIDSSGSRRDTKRKKTEVAPEWRPVPGRLTLNPGPDDGARPAYYLLKILRAKQQAMLAEGKNVGEDCSQCCLYHQPNKVCDIFSFPAYRTPAFKELWATGRQAGVIRTTETEEWNGRPRRRPRNRTGADGKSVTNKSWRHLRTGVEGGPK